MIRMPKLKSIYHFCPAFLSSPDKEITKISAKTINTARTDATMILTMFVTHISPKSCIAIDLDLTSSHRKLV